MSNNCEDLSITLPDQKNYEKAYGLAYKLACEKLSRLSSLEKQCSNSESICQITGSYRRIIVKYLNRNYQVNYPEIDISIPDSRETVEIRDKILILHYLTQAKGTSLSGKLIDYHEMREGSVYFPTFYQRAIKPLANHFGYDPQRLRQTSELFGGQPANYGDTSVTIPAFKRVPITLVLWKGDEEFPPNANILFNSSVSDYLPAEDIIVLCQSIVWRLIKLSG